MNTGESKDRWFPRRNRRLKVEMNGALGETWDISMGGFAAEMGFVPRCGSIVHGSLSAGAQHYQFTGEVVWVRGGEPGLGRFSRVGVRFTGVENAYLEAMKTLH